jgi:hypothetical protein
MKNMAIEPNIAERMFNPWAGSPFHKKEKSTPTRLYKEYPGWWDMDMVKMSRAISPASL